MDRYDLQEYHCIIGIDPGLTGGVSCITSSGLMAIRMPVMKGVARTIDIPALMAILDDWDPDHVFIEYQHSMPKQGVASTFRAGKNYGVILGILAALRIPHTVVRAQEWKRSLAVPKDKSLARARASELFPNNSQDWRLKREDGVAESAMIAEFGRRQLGIH